MPTDNTLRSILSSLSSLLEEERICLRNVKYGALKDINRRKSEALRILDGFMNQANAPFEGADELEEQFDRVRREARRNTQLLGSALNGAKSAADVLDYIRTGEPRLRRARPENGHCQDDLVPVR